MSNNESFIDEVNDELRRERLFGYLRRYGWIAALVIVLIVGGAAFSEYRKAAARAEAEAVGDGLLAALAQEEEDARIAALETMTPGSPGAQAVAQLLTAAQQHQAGDTEAAVATLDAIAVDGDVPQVYRQVARFKSLTLQTGMTPAIDRRQAFEAMAQPGTPMRLLAEEQLALIDIEEGDPEAAIARYQAIVLDAEVTQDLQQRALQVIVALGGDPELSDIVQGTGITDQ